MDLYAFPYPLDQPLDCIGQLVVTGVIAVGRSQKSQTSIRVRKNTTNVPNVSLPRSLRIRSKFGNNALFDNVLRHELQRGKQIAEQGIAQANRLFRFLKSRFVSVEGVRQKSTPNATFFC